MNHTGPEINGAIQKDLKNANVTAADCKSALLYQIVVLDSSSKGVRIPPVALTSHVIARSSPGDIKEWGLAVLVAIGGGMFLTQVVETGLFVLERMKFRENRKWICSLVVKRSLEGIVMSSNLIIFRNLGL